MTLVLVLLLAVFCIPYSLCAPLNPLKEEVSIYQTQVHILRSMLESCQGIQRVRKEVVDISPDTVDLEVFKKLYLKYRQELATCRRRIKGNNFAKAFE